MRKNVLKFLSFILVLSLVLGLGTGTAYAEGDAEPQENVEGSEAAENEDGEVTIVSTVVDPHKIPDTRDPLNVQEGTIASNFFSWQPL